MSDHAIPLEVDSASEDHKTTFQGTMRNARTLVMLSVFSFLAVVFVFANSLGAVAVGVIASMGAFKFLGGRWISAFAWAALAVVLFTLIAIGRSLIVG